MQSFYSPNSVFDHKDLTPLEKLTYLYLCRRANGQGQCFPRYNKIAEDCGFSRRTAIRTISKLVELGLIVLTHRFQNDGRQTSNLYTIVKHVTLRVTKAAHKVKDYIKTSKDRYKSTQNSKKKEMIRELYLS